MMGGGDGLLIRSAVLADCGHLCALNARCHASAWSERQFQAACVSEYDVVLLAEDGLKQLLGFVVWQAVGDEMEVHLIATAPEYQRRGIASRLLIMMFQAASEQGISRVILEVRASNVAAQMLYHRYGFTTIAQRKQYYADGEDALIMEKIC